MDSNIYQRPKAAWNKLRAARADGIDVFLCGPTGYGKTELVKRCLQPSETTFLSAWHMTAADLAPEKLPIGRTLVIDDLQWAEAEDLQQTILALLRRTDLWVVLICRVPSPEWLMPAFRERILTIISEKDLALSSESAKELLLQYHVALPHEDFDRLFSSVDGSPVGIRITAQFLAAGNSFDKAAEQRLLETYYLYLDQHVYSLWPEELQEFMLKLSLLDSFTVPIAVEFTGRADAELLIHRLQHLSTCFIGTPENYIIRPHLRNCLRSRMNRTWLHSRRNALCQQAGQAYERLGLLPQALEFYSRVNNTAAIALLLEKNASRNVGVGYYYEMRSYYFQLPEATVSASPALMAALSMLTSMMLNLPDSERWYHALQEYRRQAAPEAQNTADGWLLYLDIALPHRGSDEVLSLLHANAAKILHRDLSLPEFSITSGQPSIINGSKDFSHLCRKDKEISSVLSQPIALALGRNGRGLIDLSVAESQFEQGAGWEMVLSLATSGLMAAQAGGKQELQFVAIATIARIYCLRGQAGAARSLMDQYGRELKGHSRVQENLGALQARLDLYLGHPEAAAKWLRSLPEGETSFDGMERYRYLAKVRLLIIQEHFEEALALLERLHWYAVVMKRPYIRIECHMLKAIIQYRQENPRWTDNLDIALRRAEELNLVRVLSREGAALLPLLNARAVPTDTPFLQLVWQETRNMADHHPNYLTHAALEGPELDGFSLQLLHLLAEGCSRKKIAEITGQPERTVKYRTELIYHTLGAAGKMEAVEKARKMGLL